MNGGQLSIRTSTIRSASVSVAVFGSVGDPEGTRTVTSIVALLVALGVALVMLAVWLYRTTRPDPELLAPLEVMGDRKWRRGDPVWQRRRLDEIRPQGAVPLEPSIAPPNVDEAFDRGPSATGFDDLHDVSLDELGAPNGEGRPAPATASPAVSENEPAEVADTPEALIRPDVGDLPDGELDPEVLAAAQAQLDVELGPDRP